MDTIFDVGMYDGEDTAYYLDLGYRVVAVEANPSLLERAKLRFRAEIESGRLELVEAALTVHGGPAQLALAGSDLASSSLFGEKVAGKDPTGVVTVASVTLPALFDRYGVPHYLKIDIEGADRFCVLALDRRLPQYLSFEVGDDARELLQHAMEVGYSRFKIIHQNSFRRSDRSEPVIDRLTRWLADALGYRDPRLVRRAGRFFVRGSSTGPVPWMSDGPWRSADEIFSILSAGLAPGWHDIQAAL